nr:helix-turn-helix transcriptional regulator [Chryseobacterium daecheongense]
MSFFGTNIKKIRQVKGLSQKAFADLFDLNRGVISSYEEGRAEPKIETILKVAGYFNLNLNKLLTETLQVNQLVSVSDIDHLMFEPDGATTGKVNEIQTSSNCESPNAVILQKILANVNLIYEFTRYNVLLSQYQYGDILFLNKVTGDKKDIQSLLVYDDGNLQYASDVQESNITNQTFYKIVGFLSMEHKNVLADILERLQRLENTKV